MIWTLYNAKTGAITGTTTDAIRAGSEPSISGNYNSEHYYVRQGRALRKSPRPSAQPHVVYDFDYATLNWQINQSATAQRAREHRNMLFKYVDKISPIWYDSMPAQQRLTAQTYRSQLLAVPDQPGFPEHIVWPIVPEFLRIG